MVGIASEANDDFPGVVGLLSVVAALLVIGGIELAKRGWELLARRIWRDG